MRAATQLSDIRNQTERRHLRHSSQEHQESRIYLFTPFLVDYSLVDILLLEICIIPPGAASF